MKKKKILNESKKCTTLRELIWASFENLPKTLTDHPRSFAIHLNLNLKLRKEHKPFIDIDRKIVSQSLRMNEMSGYGVKRIIDGNEN